MQRTLINFWLDAILLILFLLLVWVSCVLQFVFPPGPNAAGWTLWNFDYVEWSRFHFALVCGMVLTILLHVMLHWSWVCGVIAMRIAARAGGKRKIDEAAQTLYGVGLLIVLLNVLGITLAVAVLTVRSPMLPT